jgi:hypothetical protein
MCVGICFCPGGSLYKLEMKVFHCRWTAVGCLCIYHVLSSWTTQTTWQYLREISTASVPADETTHDKCNSFSQLFHLKCTRTWLLVWRMDVRLQLTNFLGLNVFYRKLFLRVGLCYDMLTLLSHSCQNPPSRRCRTPFREVNIPDFRPVVSRSQFRYYILSTCSPFYLSPKDMRWSSSLKEHKVCFAPYTFQFVIHSHSVFFPRYVFCLVSGSSLNKPGINKSGSEQCLSTFG